jgi:prophage DNA circulation protein
MRNWQRDLRAASFRGVRFWVEADSLSGGKRIARHEYAGGRRTTLEEAGLATKAYDVTAYLLGDTSDFQALALETACLAVGPGRLVLPIDGGFMAYVENFNRSRERDRQGYMAFGFSAVPLDNEPGGILGLGDVVTAFTTQFAEATAGFSRLF